MAPQLPRLYTKPCQKEKNQQGRHDHQIEREKKLQYLKFGLGTLIDSYDYQPRFDLVSRNSNTLV